MAIGIPGVMADHSPAFVALVDAARRQIRECSIHDLKARMDRGEVPGPGVVLVDVREESEWAKDHLPGAVHIGKGVIERDIEAKVPDTTTELLLYCGGGYRSALAAANLKAMGYENVVSVDGGIRAWRAAGFPLTTG
jgi:rhodanese-related sulfurtransferase